MTNVEFWKDKTRNTPISASHGTHKKAIHVRIKIPEFSGNFVYQTIIFISNVVADITVISLVFPITPRFWEDFIFKMYIKCI